MISLLSPKSFLQYSQTLICKLTTSDTMILSAPRSKDRLKSVTTMSCRRQKPLKRKWNSNKFGKRRVDLRKY